LLCSTANSFGTSLEFAAFGRGPDAKYNRANAFCFLFYVHNHGFCGGPNAFSQEKHPRIYLDRAAINKQSDKFKINKDREWTSSFPTKPLVWDSIPSGGKLSFFNYSNKFFFHKLISASGKVLDLGKSIY